MAKAIVDYLGKRTPRPTPDLIFDSEALPQNASTTSAAFNVGKTQLSLELVVQVETELSLAAGSTVTVEYLYGDAFGSSEVLFTQTDGTGTTAFTVAVGELTRFVPPTDFPVEAQLQITTDDAAATGAISAWPEYVAR